MELKRAKSPQTNRSRKEQEQEKRDKALRQWLRFMGLPEDDMEDLREMLSAYPYRELVRPLICRDIRKGMSRRQIMIKYKVTGYTVRRFGCELGVYTS